MFEIKKKWFEMRFFPKAALAKMILGAWWLVEAIGIEPTIANLFFNKAQWELLGPANIGFFISALGATIYGTLCLGLGYVQWSLERRAKKPL